MYLLSSEQFSKLALLRFHQRCADILQKNYSKKTPPETDLMELILNRDIEARNEEFISELDRFRYIHAAFVMGTNFPKDYRVMTAILDRKDLSPNDRSYLLEETMLSMFRIVCKQS